MREHHHSGAGNAGQHEAAAVAHDELILPVPALAPCERTDVPPHKAARPERR